MYASDPNNPNPPEDAQPTSLALVIISRLAAGIAAIFVCYLLYRIVQGYYDMTRHRSRNGAKGYSQVADDDDAYGDEEDGYRDSISIGSPGPGSVAGHNGLDGSILNRPLPARPLPDKPLPSLPEGD